jgi:hypothetical protein
MQLRIDGNNAPCIDVPNNAEGPKLFSRLFGIGDGDPIYSLNSLFTVSNASFVFDSRSRLLLFSSSLFVLFSGTI